jgi:AraC-like DNA-binding protein
MLETARRRLDDPLLGLHLGQTVTPAHFGMLGYLLLNSASLGAALAAGGKYVRLLLQRPMRTRFGQRDGTVSLEWELRRSPEDVLSIEAHLTALVALMRNMTGEPLPLQGVSFSHARIGRQAAYDRYFGCPVQFGQAALGLYFPAAYLQLPVRNADPDLLILLTHQANTALAALPHDDGLKRTVQESIVRILRNTEPSIDRVAELMHLSRRTLQRRLDDSGLNFRQLLDETRLELARAYLGDSRLQLKDISYLLGFAEPSAFNRAFKRWTGVSPGEYLKTRIGAP